MDHEAILYCNCNYSKREKKKKTTIRHLMGKTRGKKYGEKEVKNKVYKRKKMEDLIV